VKVYLDGYSKDFDITYYRDPSLYKFDDKNNVHLFDNDQQKLTIKVISFYQGQINEIFFFFFVLFFV
jgi:hypothetical protein